MYHCHPVYLLITYLIDGNQQAVDTNFAGSGKFDDNFFFCDDAIPGFFGICVCCRKACWLLPISEYLRTVYADLLADFRLLNK